MNFTSTVILRLKEFEKKIEDVGLQSVKLEKIIYNRDDVDMISVVISYRDPDNKHKRRWAGFHI